MFLVSDFWKMIKVLIFLMIFSNTFAQVSPPAPVGPIPSENQLRWQEMEFYAFVHFSINTYTDMAWGYGNEDPKLFNPDQLDCRQWARVCKEAGMKGIIITAKHHSGFCLWPSKYTDYSVKQAPWKSGKGDVVRELADACKEYGLKLGIYLSPWDRNYADYGKPKYIKYFRNQLTELLTNYGEIFEVWFDGANGGTGFYGGANENRKIDRTTYYDWKNTYALVRKLQPKMVIWNDGGDRADLRWVGTEAGYVGETNWSLLNAEGDVPEEMLRHGVENGNAWVPGEVNTSIRPEWFYHKKEDNKVKTLPQLMDIYYHSIGRNGTLLLNFPIMPNGLIHEKDVKAMQDLTAALKEEFSQNLLEGASVVASTIRGNDPQYGPTKVLDSDKNTFWAADEGHTTGTLSIMLPKVSSFNRILIQEPIALGQRVKSFKVEAFIEGVWTTLDEQTTIGYKRILRLPTVRSAGIRITITDAKACPLISNIELYNAPQILAPPSITRNKNGEVEIVGADPESVIYYTLDGSDPSVMSEKYVGKILTTEGKVGVKAIAFDPFTSKTSTIGEENFEISRKYWTVPEVKDERINDMMDGNANTSWQFDKGSRDSGLVIDMSRNEQIKGFKYLPPQHWWEEGNIITGFSFYISDDMNDWKLMKKGEFSNIKNNPVWQEIEFDVHQSCRYLKFVPTQTVSDQSQPRIAELEVLTP